MNLVIFAEGGGEGPSGKAAFRAGLGQFFNPLRELARQRASRWRIVVCGGRDQALSAFKNEMLINPNDVSILLVDAESEVHSDVISHLRRRDGWDLSPQLQHRVFLMAQTMETWIIADVDTLSAFYGRDFNMRALPAIQRDLEAISKQEINASLAEATKRTKKGVYHKIRHAVPLLEGMSCEIVRHRCSHCDRFFTEVAHIIES